MGEGEIFLSLVVKAQNGTLAHVAFYSMGTCIFLPRLKPPEHEALMSRLRILGAIPPRPPFVFLACCLMKKIEALYTRNCLT
jgi:hypothetical protein